MSRWVSSIQGGEGGVTPTNAVPTSSATVVSPVMNPEQQLPLMLTVRVPSGNERVAWRATARSTMNCATEPSRRIGTPGPHGDVHARIPTWRTSTVAAYTRHRRCMIRVQTGGQPVVGRSSSALTCIVEKVVSRHRPSASIGRR